MHEAYHGHSYQCTVLLAAGADPNLTEPKNLYTALMFGVLGGSASVVTTLLGAGAERSLTNKRGQTAGQLAAFVGHHGLVELISSFVPLTVFEQLIGPDIPAAFRITAHEARQLYGLVSLGESHTMADRQRANAVRRRQTELAQSTSFMDFIGPGSPGRACRDRVEQSADGRQVAAVHDPVIELFVSLCGTGVTTHSKWTRHSTIIISRQETILDVG